MKNENTKPLRIAFFIEIFLPNTNGVVTTTLNLARNLITEGHEIYIFAPKRKDFSETELEGGIHVCYIPSVPVRIYPGMRINSPWSQHVYDLLKLYKIDIVHATGPWLMAKAGFYAAQKLNIAKVMTHHTLIDNKEYIKYALKSDILTEIGMKFVWKSLFSKYFIQCDLITAPSKFAANAIKMHHPNKEVIYISNGIDVESFQIPIDIELQPAVVKKFFEKDKTFLYVGRLGYEKSIDILIKAMALVVKQNPSLKLLIIGDGPALNELKKISKSLNLVNNICFAGKIPNPTLIRSGIIRNSRAFVTASKTENQPITVIEAICSDCPVILPNVSGINELASIEYGWIYEADNTKQLAECILDAYNNDEKYEKLVLELKNNCKKFDGHRIANEFEDIYYSLIERVNQTSIKRSLKYNKHIKSF